MISQQAGQWYHYKVNQQPYRVQIQVMTHFDHVLKGKSCDDTRRACCHCIKRLLAGDHAHRRGSQIHHYASATQHHCNLCHTSNTGPVRSKTEQWLLITPRHAQHSTQQQSSPQHSIAQHKQHRKAQHSTAQHSTAQHSTAQHSTAQHSTAQRSAAQHSSKTHNAVPD